MISHIVAHRVVARALGKVLCFGLHIGAIRRTGRGRHQIVTFRFLNVIVLVAAMALGACAGPGTNLPPLPETTPGPYRLAAEDQLRITVFEDNRLSGEVRVADSGAVAIPLLGPVQVGGLTVSEAEARIRREFQRRQLLQDPGVAVQVIAYRPIFVLGMVERGGQFPYQPGMTVLSAVALAGGFNYRAVQDRVSVTRADPDGRSREFRADRASQLQPGDVVTVFERFF
ncbi:polysaccharide export protein [Roseomonas oryzicola]|uniref:Polysaccharide export protein n=1 Tax=Neoroseomonas oryzicola TaxID=535904 RepID=A0A9X9WHT9_9PROT|nr:polysaccharide export protein [Neoroseomonas oryzicola]NKE15661.1 polysaccharide export protein [Neoroseomonas oryzicola]